MTLDPYITTHRAVGVAQASATTETYNLSTRGRKGLIVAVDVTALTATGQYTVSILGVLPVSGKTYPILTGVAIVATGTQVLQVSPGMVAAANLVANAVLPSTVRISIAHLNAVSVTASVESLLTP